VRGAARRPGLLLLAIVILTLLELAALSLTTVLAETGMGAWAWRDVFVGQLVGWVAAWWYLLRRHPQVWAQLRMASDD
jgi:hypothetical protein